MKARVSDGKLRGGFYTPPGLVDVVLRRALSLAGGLPNRLRILEPTAGNGAFLKGLAGDAFRRRVAEVTAIEIDGGEAAQCVHVAGELNTRVINDDFLGWRVNSREEFDMAVGNPPFVRSHFMSETSKSHALHIGAQLGLPNKRVSNLWTPVFLGAVSRLRVGGVFSFIVPFEMFFGISAVSARQWLALNTEQLRCDVLPSGSFIAALQEVVVVSGRRRAMSDRPAHLTIEDHGDEHWQHRIDIRQPNWTRYLRTPSELEALTEARALRNTRPLGLVAKFDTSTVTGANTFFAVGDPTIAEHGLGKWVIPYLPRGRNAKGLIYKREDHQALKQTGAVCSLLDFGPGRPNPFNHPGARSYILSGEAAGFDKRYKTRTRHPWFRIPHLSVGQLMFSKLSHQHPRVIVNEAEVVTTDSMYRGRVLDTQINAEDFTASFHNSLTFLTAEIEGRSLGGGVFEIMPSEFSRITVPFLPGCKTDFDTWTT